MKKTLLKSCVYLLLGCFSFSNVQAQTTLTVTNTLDDNSAGSLRAVVATAVNGDTIRFAPSLISSGSTTITLTSGAITFTADNLVFIGEYNATNTLFISGNNASQVFNSNASNLTSFDSMDIINGNVSGYGGGIYSNNNVTVTNSTISGNTATSLGGGGGIYADNGNVTIINSTISGNTITSGGYGGGIYSNNNVTVTNSTINGNTVTGGGLGGGIYSNNTVTVTNSTVSENTATTAGGIYANNNVTVTNSTISVNTASIGGGIYGSPIAATSSIIANNTGGDLFDPISFSSNITTDGGYNIFTDVPSGAVGTDQTGVNSGQLDLGLLQNNGGPTFTMLPGASSVAIGNGNPGDNSPDQRGYVPTTSRDVGSVVTTADALVVTLIKFTGQVVNNKSSLLQWSTAQEAAGDITLIMRSNDGLNWKEIGQQVSSYNTSNISSHSFTDNNPNTPVSYYRLKMINTNGTIKYSGTIALSFTEQSQATVYPNPIAGNSFTIDMGTNVTSPVTYNLYNVSGQLIQQGLITNRVQVISANNITPGYYLLSLQNGPSFSLIRK